MALLGGILLRVTLPCPRFGSRAAASPIVSPVTLRATYSWLSWHSRWSPSSCSEPIGNTAACCSPALPTISRAQPPHPLPIQRRPPRRQSPRQPNLRSLHPPNLQRPNPN